MGRCAAIAAIIAVVVLQQIPPLFHYLGPPHQRTDERFAWRMFSSTWLERKRCRVSYEDHFQSTPALDVDRERRFDAAWLPVLQRQWPWATQRILEHRCRTRAGLESVTLIRTCGRERPLQIDYVCAGPSVRS